jgi:hypothetical protein
MRRNATSLWKRRPSRWLIAVASASVVAGGAGAAIGAPGDGHPIATGAKLRHRVAPPRLLAPADRGTYEATPAFSWSAASGAAKYEFELSADSSFGSTLYTIQTLNTFVTIDKSITDGTYYWRVRSINSKDVAGLWSRGRSYTKRWSTAPAPLAPADGAQIVYPATPLVLRWSAVPHAFKYLVYVATDPSLASLVPGLGRQPVDPSGTTLAVPTALAPGRYYWGVTPEDAEKHTGTPSRVSSFDWSWPTGTVPSLTDASGVQVTDGSGLPEVLSPELSWNAVHGAAQYEVEINSASDFAPGSKVCCSDTTTGTALSPVHYLPNNVYYWRVRALDIDGNAGTWNIGPSFRKAFDDQSPSIVNLTLRDPGTAGDDAIPVGSTSSAPLITWDPVTGASKYEVDIAPYNSGILQDCDWSLKVPFFTATTAWTPLAERSGRPQPTGWPIISSDGFKSIGAGTYCARVTAISDRDQTSKDVISAPTPLGGPNQPGFTYAPATAPGNPGLAFAQSSDYLSMQSGSSTTGMPVFRWKPIADAASYYVVVAKDSAFTKIVDAAITNAPVYAPRTGSISVRTYPDETTHYYWQVLPAAVDDGTTCHCDLTTNNPQSFDKSSVAPVLRSPADGAVVGEQPTFAWTAAQGARSFELQVAQDPTFANPIDDVKTDSLSYTSSSTYPADTTLYWRVRASDENNIGLNWSTMGTFRRVLPVPALTSPDLATGTDVPLVTWAEAPGSTSYTLHVEQGDGTTRDFSTSSTAFTPTGFFGLGNIRWQVRANYPKSGVGETPGAYSGMQTFTRQIDAPRGVRWTYARHHVLLSWDPSTNIGTKQYKVQVSATNSFSSLVDSHTTENTSYAPSLTQLGFQKGGTLYWRVAAVDERGTVGAWTSRTLTLGGRMKIRVSGRLRHRHRGTVHVKLTNSHGRAIRGGKVRVTGVGFRAIAKRTSSHGTVTFRLRPMRKGQLRFQGSKSGYQSVSRTLRIR